MKSIRSQLSDCVRAALLAAFGDAAEGVDPLVKPAGDPKFGDYQSDVAMGLAKRLRQKPRDVAGQIVTALPPATEDMLESAEIAGPGFINMRLKAEFLESSLDSIPAAPAAAGPGPDRPMSTALPTESGFDRLGIDRVSDAERQTVVIDYSSPNVAKILHVGHLRSTIIGDCIVRVLEFEGHKVIRQNHIGDWGTQFGIILEELRSTGRLQPGWPDGPLPWGKLPHNPDEMEEVYRAGHAKMSDPKFADRARQAVTRLQSGAQHETSAWAHVKGSSMLGVLDLYGLLGVSLRGEHTRGESFYNPLLPGVVEELRVALQSPERKRRDKVTGNATTGDQPLACARGSDRDDVRAVCREDQGALCVFLENEEGTPAFKSPQGDPLPMLIQKSDGAFLYTTTDLAALLFRINHLDERPVRIRSGTLAQALRSNLVVPPELDPDLAKQGGLGADRILYVVGVPQKLHFQMLFATVRALGWTKKGDSGVRLEHVSFGSVLGENRKMLKTRTGENVKLKALLDEAVQRAEKLVRDTEADPEKRRGFSDDEIKTIAETVGIAAVKYADLCQNRNTDYVFSWDKMLALAGNTAPYMLYAYARIRSIYRKGAESAESAIRDRHSAIKLDHPAERALAVSILRLAETVDAVAETLLPNILCEYLYDLAGRFMTFYETCPVLQAPDEATQASRLRLCDLTARALKLGLGLLGIPTLERM